MVYSKPEIVVLASAISSIQGAKIGGMEIVTNHPRWVADSELDD